MSVVGRNSLLGRASMPLLLGKTPVVHRSSYNQLARPGAFRKTRPIGGGGVYNDCPYPYTKAPSALSPLRTFPTQYKKSVLWCFVLLAFMVGRKFATPNDDWVFFAQNEAARRRRERRERHEIDCLGIDEDDVCPKLVAEIDQLYVKGRKCTN
eukprot:Rhum_TRINITY_DN22924_c0_g1::Rhum_TRINITY_DN22924_c0_g1_i1::g.176498::m.176498